MLMVDVQAITKTTGFIHIRWKGKRADKPSPIGELKLDRVAQAIAGGVNAIRLRVNERELVIASAATALASHPSAPLVFLRTHGAGLTAEMARGLPVSIYVPDGEASSPRELRELNGSEVVIVARSVHDLDAALAAERGGADMLVLGTVFPSKSHSGGSTIGLEGVREVCAAVTIPVIGIGGITAANAGDVIRAGASGVAVISAIFDAPDPRAAAAELRAAIDTAWAERRT
jgi:thiamine-phosphate pyrophosphorylase